MSTESSQKTPESGTLVSVVVSLISISIISSFLTQKHAAVKDWRRLPWAIWLVLALYVDSFAFVFGTAFLKFGIGLERSSKACDGAILLCLVAYVSTKVVRYAVPETPLEQQNASCDSDPDLVTQIIYMFLVEKTYLIRGALVPRLRSKLWVFNTFGMLGAYCVVIVLNFVFRIAHIDQEGLCVIGMERRALLPLIIFDLVVNVYLTSLFILPIMNLQSFRIKERAGAVEIRKMTVRTLVGSLCTLTSSIVNLSVLTALDGEPGWVCLLCCNSDVLFSVIVVHWVTFNDHAGSRRSHQLSSYNDYGSSHTAHKQGTLGPPSSSFTATTSISAVPPAHAPVGGQPCPSCRCLSCPPEPAHSALAAGDRPQQAQDHNYGLLGKHSLQEG